ncbi:MAG: tagaturonate epimerase family protein [Planctomycetota bacterium]|nr:tagaturonate epimerase family protein [Planctomycetota bacterium]
MATSLTKYFSKTGTEARRVPPAGRAAVVKALREALPALTLYSDSGCAVPGGLVLAARDGEQRVIVACGALPGLKGAQANADGVPVAVCHATKENMAVLRALVPYLRVRLPGSQSSVGLGDRLGLGTPGHIEAAKKSGFFLVLAQQSIREMQRTARSAQQVLDEATFGVFQCGYDAGFGADADHLKTTDDVDLTAAAGFNSFTIDPSAHVDDTVAGAAPGALAAKFEKLISDGVPGVAAWRKKYVGQTFMAGAAKVSFDEATLLCAAVKYGRAVAHVEAMARHIAQRVPQHEIELSVDETALPTSVAEHLFVSHELRERGVKIHSLAPRFVGDFEKGIDYKGDLKTFEESLAQHFEIAKHYGPYKLSIHSGSDKFSIYPIVARVTGGWFHVKTAGTSYLEALRVVARRAPAFFRELAGFCRGRYETDRKTYHVSAVLNEIPPAEQLGDADLERVYLDEDGGRQILHVTFGTVLTYEEAGQRKYRGRLLSLLNREAETYVAVLKKHIGRHIAGLQRRG